MPIVIDASIALSWCFPDEDNVYANRVLDALVSENAIVPAIWGSEVTNVLLGSERSRRIDESDVAKAIDVLTGLRVREQSISLEETFSAVALIARRTGLTSYDASYLHLAMRENATLATLDRRLRDAAEAVGCAVFE